jgi:hypothetical protein
MSGMPGGNQRGQVRDRSIYRLNGPVPFWFDRRNAKNVTQPPLVPARPPGDHVGLFVISSRQWQQDLDNAGGSPERTLDFYRRRVLSAPF